MVHEQTCGSAYETERYIRIHIINIGACMHCTLQQCHLPQHLVSVLCLVCIRNDLRSISVFPRHPKPKLMHFHVIFFSFSRKIFRSIPSSILFMRSRLSVCALFLSSGTFSSSVGPYVFLFSYEVSDSIPARCEKYFVCVHECMYIQWCSSRMKNETFPMRRNA